ncbi:MAG: hypothetical protein HOV80_30295 [Polyangiaceae bacterium]|nr:hypothetical protein [Polyangiaceae bacterium]
MRSRSVVSLIPLLSSATVSCSSPPESEPAEPTSCVMTLSGEVDGIAVDQSLMLIPAGSMEYAKHFVKFGVPDGPSLYGYADQQVINDDPQGPFRFLFRPAPSDGFLVSTSATWSLDQTTGKRFRMTDLGRLPSCAEGTPSSLQMRFCFDTGCDANLTVTAEDGTELRFGNSEGGGGHPFVMLGFVKDYHPVGGVFVLDGSSADKAAGFVVFGEDGPDPWSVHCVEGTASLNAHGGLAGAELTRIVRVGSFTEATPVAGSIQGKDCAQ